MTGYVIKQREELANGRLFVVQTDTGLYSLVFEIKGELIASHRLEAKFLVRNVGTKRVLYRYKIAATNPAIVGICNWLRSQGNEIVVPAKAAKTPRERKPAMTQIQIEAIIEEAFAAAREASYRQWLRDGQQDIGACGGYILNIDARSPVAKLLLDQGRAYKTSPGVGVMYPRHEAIRSQHMEICVQAGRAARAVFEKYGVRVTEARSYID